MNLRPEILSCITTLLDLTPKIAPLRPHNPNTEGSTPPSILANDYLMLPTLLFFVILADGALQNTRELNKSSIAKHLWCTDMKCTLFRPCTNYTECPKGN
jgi:hypothetical protein